jgi:hypothetical protein
LERYPEGWAERVFRDASDFPGGYVSPTDWKPGTLREAIDVADASGREGLVPERLAAFQLSADAKSVESKWNWANHRLGDSASGAEYEVGYIAWNGTAAVTECCAADIAKSVVRCLEYAAAAIGFRWDHSEHLAALAAERNAQAEVIRSHFLRPHEGRTNRG